MGSRIVGVPSGAMLTQPRCELEGGSPGRSSQPYVRGNRKARLRSELRRGRLRPQPGVENEAWWAARDSISARDGGSSSLP